MTKSKNEISNVLSILEARIKKNEQKAIIKHEASKKKRTEFWENLPQSHKDFLIILWDGFIEKDDPASKHAATLIEIDGETLKRGEFSKSKLSKDKNLIKPTR